MEDLGDLFRHGDMVGSRERQCPTAARTTDQGRSSSAAETSKRQSEIGPPVLEEERPSRGHGTPSRWHPRS